jgi:hypothetical protein
MLPVVRVLLFMARHIVQCQRVLREGDTQSFRADNVHVCVSQPHLFDYRRYIENLPSMFSGPELTLQMLCDLQV